MSIKATQRPRKLLLKCFPRQVTLPSIIGVKRGRAGRSISALERQCRSPGCHQVISLPSRSEHCSSDDDGETTSADEGIVAQHNSLLGNQLSLALTKDLKQLLRDKFASWREGIECTAPAEVNMPPRKRCKVLQCESGFPRAEEEEDNEEEFVVISSPERKKAFFHLACPFFVSAPQRYQQCLVKNDFDSIETLISHLLRHHNRPLYCPTCRKTFKTLIGRDDHVLENRCKMNNQQILEGLTESQKAKLIKRDRYYLGEVRRWRCIWSTLFPDSEQPRSPYLDDKIGLKASMVRDFWAGSGERVVSQFLTAKDVPTDENSAIYKTICHTALESLMDWVLFHDGCLSSLTSEG
ncbi:uncharacterized protein FFUJ_13877 [Fusarium fujikuroi IMI 58289]|uniref:C2H2-type domain-containing protein n=1 Tax=Gibberella fujikuroi (strain CBS 195.34 / IMI 58289 / NRRL A-6831) TaxID=1279085 RepID=S0EIC2_GIBF5|nr:uncharacterized protein FFUJ_13877 [Fusarium fujikuroi IMI 58289]CCT72123.1 uncharacterized protein FFUJ_13877 [Fusarium fujikuroi IMI 58289]SCO18349.1 uncharacterized protein FFM5_11818 [Fusarium fujikuroi]